MTLPLCHKFVTKMTQTRISNRYRFINKVITYVFMTTYQLETKTKILTFIDKLVTELKVYDEPLTLIRCFREYKDALFQLNYQSTETISTPFYTQLERIMFKARHADQLYILKRIITDLLMTMADQPDTRTKILILRDGWLDEIYNQDKTDKIYKNFGKTGYLTLFPEED